MMDFDPHQPWEPAFGHVGENVFWTNGRLTIYRYCDRVFELLCDGVAVMPITSFERINEYLWAEFDLPGFNC